VLFTACAGGAANTGTSKGAQSGNPSDEGGGRKLDASASNSTSDSASNGGSTDFGNPSGSGGVAGKGGESGSAADGGGTSLDGGTIATGNPDGTCDLGAAGSFATDEKLDLFGSTVYFAKGKTLPKGRYRVQYVDGCMKYDVPQAWAVHASTMPPTIYQFWLVGDTTTDKILTPPGTTGYQVGSGGFDTFEACVAANQQLSPIEFDFAGGKIGVWLEDSPYSDNQAGVDGRNPKWSLTLLGKCPVLL
jgi:hypothetical protein